MLRILAILSAALGAWTVQPALAGFEAAAFERAMFRTVTLLYATAPRGTVAAATRCMVTASERLPDGFRQTVIEIDRRPVYRGSDRLNAIADVLVTFEEEKIRPLSSCFDRLGAGEFGETQGATPATAVPKPDHIPDCPISTSHVSGDGVTCYCQPMLGGVVYGHKTYSDASSICLASRHAGATDYLSGGVVTVVFGEGCASYESVESNGSLSAAEGRTARSFHFLSVGKGACPK